MSNFSRDPILLTPGPLTTSLAHQARDAARLGLVGRRLQRDHRERARASCWQIVHGEGTHVCVPLQGSGTFSVEAAVNTLVPRDGHVLVLDNGAYGKRIGRLATDDGAQARRSSRRAEDVPIDGRRTSTRLLAADAEHHARRR